MKLDEGQYELRKLLTRVKATVTESPVCLPSHHQGAMKKCMKNRETDAVRLGWRGKSVLL